MAFRGPPATGLAKGNLAGVLDQGKGGPIDAVRAARLLLEAARSGNDEILEMLEGDLQKWTKNTRTELKRELAHLGRYKGPRGDTWDGRANMVTGRYRGQRADPAAAAAPPLQAAVSVVGSRISHSQGSIPEHRSRSDSRHIHPQEQGERRIRYGSG